MRQPIKVLLMEDDDKDAELLKHMLNQASAEDREQETNFIPPFYLQRASRLDEGLRRLQTGDIDLILLDLSLPDSHGLDTFTRVRTQAPKVAVIVLSGQDDEDAAIKTMRAGAQDYLVKGRVDRGLLARAIRYAVERKRAEETIRRAKEEAEHASNAKGQFLSRMSHELRTPLNAILGFAQVLESIPHLPDRESVDQILKGGRHLLDLINEVLEFSRIESGRLEIALAPVPVADVVREALDLVRPLAISQKVRLIGEPGVSCSYYVHANRQRLKQVLLNLLSNAVKYNRFEGTVTVSCEGSLRPRDGRDRPGSRGGNGSLRISIIDTGIGIAADKLERLFIPFERVGADDSEVEGTGLGLAVSKGLVEAMGGVIGVESDYGNGSIFWVELPFAEGAPRQLEDPAAASTSVRRNERPRVPVENQKVVLYIEDNLSNLRLIDRVLAGRPGIKLISALRGATGIQLAQQNPPDLILLDLNLPDMNGADVLKRLQELPETASSPVVVISADATAAQIERLLTAGARSYLTKPIDVKEFLVTVDTMLREPAALNRKAA